MSVNKFSTSSKQDIQILDKKLNKDLIEIAKIACNSNNKLFVNIMLLY